MNTTEVNKKFAEFLGWGNPNVGNGLGRMYDFKLSNTLTIISESELYHCSDCGRDSYNADHCFTEDLLFHNDWNWLMLVVDKIESLDFAVEVKRTWCRIKDLNQTIVLRWEEDATKIEAVYKACSMIVDWYTAQKK